MTESILTAAGVPVRRSRFTKPPAETYAVYFDDVTVDGADRVSHSRTGGLPRICEHDVTIELYEPTPDDAKEAAIEAELNARGFSWSKQDRYWLQDEQRYQVIYELTYYTKL